jgi:outer membrane receptor protein involved in Fe transport
MGRRSASDIDDPGGNVYLPVYNLLDGAVSYRNEKFSINLNVYNLTGVRYATQGYFNVGNNEWRYTPGEPINFRLSVGINLVNEKSSGN